MAPCKQDVPEQEKMKRTNGEPKTPLASPSSTMWRREQCGKDSRKCFLPLFSLKTWARREAAGRVAKWKSGGKGVWTREFTL